MTKGNYEITLNANPILPGVIEVIKERINSYFKTLGTDVIFTERKFSNFLFVLSWTGTEFDIARSQNLLKYLQSSIGEHMKAYSLIIKFDLTEEGF